MLLVSVVVSEVDGMFVFAGVLLVSVVLVFCVVVVWVVWGLSGIWKWC